MASYTHLYQRLQFLMDLKNFSSKKDFSNFIGIGYTQVCKWLKPPQEGEKPKGIGLKNAKQIALKYKEYQLNHHWLQTGDGEPFPEDIQNIGHKELGSKIVPLVQIPILGKVPAGIPEEVAEHTEDYISIPDAPPDSFALRVTGESMEPAIKHNDIVLFVLDQDAGHGDVVVVNDEFGDSMIKRLKIKDGNYLLTSDNPAYPTVKPNGEFRVMGKVVKVWRDITF